MLFLVAAVVSLAGTIGPDARWLAALGAAIVHTGSIPHGIPFAATASPAWHNVPVLSELAFRGLESAFGARGLLAAQIAASCGAALFVARDARRLGASEPAIAGVLLLVLTGGLLAFAGIKAQLFSLLLFPALVYLLRSEEARPSRSIWLVVPLVALWSNLHGAALVGVAVTLVYLVVHRARRSPLESAAVAAACVLALGLTPALGGTAAYYQSALTNEAAARGYGLWAPLSLHSGFDVLLIAAAVLLAAGFLRSRPSAWQVAAATALAAITVHAARNGIWLLLFLAAPAASAVPVRLGSRRWLTYSFTVFFAACAVWGLGRGPFDAGASSGVVRDALRLADGRPILADPAVAEQIADAGGRVWISNPIDAFPHSAQRRYLDWLQGRQSGMRALAGSRVVIVKRNSPNELRLRRDQAFAAAAGDARNRVFVRRR